MSGSTSLRQERAQLADQLRAHGKTVVQIAEVFRRRYLVNARAALRLAHGWSQRQAAEEWSRRWPDDIKTAKNFSYWETWPFGGHSPSIATLDRLAQLYGCKVADLLADQPDYGDASAVESPASLDMTEEHGPADNRILGDVRDLWDATLRRRAFLTGAGAAALTVLLPGLVGPTAPRHPELDEVIQAHTALITDYWRAEGVLGPGAVFSQAIDLDQQLHRWLHRVRNDAELQSIGSLVADSGILLGWLHFDLEQYDEASATYRRTLDIAEELDDVDLQAFVIGRMSRTLSECGQHPLALVFADRAQQVAGTRALPEVRSWLASTRGYVNACLGDERVSRADLEAASRLLDRADGEPLPTYIAFYGRPNLHKWAGHTLLRLADDRSASPIEGRDAINQALAIWPPSGVRESGEVMTAYAAARLAEQNIDEAARLMAEAYHVAARTGSPRVLRHLNDLRHRMRPYRQARAVRELDDLLFGP